MIDNDSTHGLLMVTYWAGVGLLWALGFMLLLTVAAVGILPALRLALALWWVPAGPLVITLVAHQLLHRSGGGE